MKICHWKSPSVADAWLCREKPPADASAGNETTPAIDSGIRKAAYCAGGLHGGKIGEFD
jgi:hypothetical protein